MQYFILHTKSNGVIRALTTKFNFPRQTIHVMFVMCEERFAFHSMKSEEETMIRDENHFSAIDHLLSRNIAPIVKEASCQ